MLDQLKELLEMQRVLDENILTTKGIKEYPLENMKVALFVELGELMNEFPTKFKHWKSTAKDDREKGLVEYVDCLHFCLSLHNYYKGPIDKWVDYDFLGKEPIKLVGTDIITLHDALRFCAKCDEDCLSWLMDIGAYFGFTWDEIYSAYKKKNAVNYERLKNGY